MTRWYERLLLRLLPSTYRARFGDEICREWQTLRQAARQERGRRGEWAYLLREGRAYVRLVRDTRAAERGPAGMAMRWRLDSRAALRRLKQRPVQVVAAGLMLAAAFTATLVAFVVANAVLWRDLPFRDPDRLVAVWEQTGPLGSLEAARVTGSRYLDWVARSTAFDGLAAFGAGGYQVESGDGVSTVRGVRAAGHFFEVLGVSPARGRLFTRNDQAPGATPVVVLSHDFWRSRYGGREDAIGQTLRLSGRAHTIIGVLPDIWLPAWPVNPAIIQLEPEHRQLWVPLQPESTLAQNRGSHVLGVVGRLAPGQTPETARQQLEALASADQSHPHGGVVRPLRGQMVQQTRGPLWILLAAACCVLLVACLNLAAIDLASFEGRLSEFRVRAALGASSAALTRQLFAEAAPVVAIAALLALGASYATLIAVEERLGSKIPLVTPPQLDGAALLVLVALSVVVAALMTAWPVLRARALSRLRDQNATRVTATNPLVFRVLIVGQLTGAVALVLTSTGLVQAFIGIGSRDPGFDPTDVHIVEMSLPRDRYRDPAAIAGFERLLQERVSSAPGVRAAAVSYDHPFEANWGAIVTVRGRVNLANNDARSQVQLRIIGPDYVDTMGARLVEGRGFNPLTELGDDGEMMVNEAFLRRESAGVGRQIDLSSPRFTWGEVAPQTFTIVGVLQDERFRGLEADIEPAVYVSTRQFPQHDLALLLRMAPGQRPSAGEVRALLRGVEPGVSAGTPLSLERIEAEQRTPRTLTTAIISGFASGALLLAATGLYGMLSLLVASRQRDIGIRLALGAAPQRIRRQVYWDGLVPVAIGTVLGLGLATLAGAGLSAFLLDISLWAPESMVIVAVVVTTVTVLAALGPARRAGRTNPTLMLR